MSLALYVVVAVGAECVVKGCWQIIVVRQSAVCTKSGSKCRMFSKASR